MSFSYQDIKDLNPQLQSEFIRQKSKIEHRQMQIGVLGRFFGSDGEGRRNIAGLVILVCLVLGAVMSSICYFKDCTFAVDFWHILSPMITCCLGYICGQTKSDSPN